MKQPPLSLRLAAAWTALRGAPAPMQPCPAPPAPSPAASHDEDDALLDARAEAARHRLEAEESARAAEALRRELEAERARRAEAIEAALASKVEGPLADAATTLGQLALQSRLIDEGKPVTARDVMALAHHLHRAFAALGLTAAADAGDTAAFDPAIHQALSGPAPAPCAPVTVRIPGYRFGERLLRKSFVEPNR